MIGKFKKALAVAGLVVGTIAAAALPAHSESLWQTIETPTTTTTEQALNALMVPIKPLVGGTSNTSTINQTGTTNYSTASIVGTGNYGLIQQAGSNNRALQAIEGNNSAALLLVNGNDNTVFQASRGNNNFQLIGIEGSGNDVAYVQVGNELAGALDITNSHNSSVFALQTPGTSNYMMPSGLSGLTNQVVIVVPGRMYVINKSAL